MVDASAWLGLSEAAKILGVHPATVRSWADRGLLASQRTLGGHRRFRRTDLVQWMEVQSTTPSTEAQLLVQSAMGRARFEISEGQLAETDWYRRLDNSAREGMRTYGRRLMEILQRYLASSSDRVLAEAREVGLDYGRVIRHQQLTLAQAVEGFFTFHDFLIEASVQVVEMGRSGTDHGDILRKVYAFTREIILALIDAYES